jgi:hypothetical protein
LKPTLDVTWKIDIDCCAAWSPDRSRSQLSCWPQVWRWSMKLMRVDPGFMKQNAVCFQSRASPDQQTGARLLETLSTLPGVQSVGGATSNFSTMCFQPVRITMTGTLNCPERARPR